VVFTAFHGFEIQSLSALSICDCERLCIPILCMYLCVIYLCICVYIHLCIYLYVFMYIYIHTHIHIYPRNYCYTYMPKRVCIYVHGVCNKITSPSHKFVCLYLSVKNRLCLGMIYIYIHMRSRMAQKLIQQGLYVCLSLYDWTYVCACMCVCVFSFA
jgi:hypothetical protein